MLQAPKQLDAAFIKLKYLYILNRQQERRHEGAKTPTRTTTHTPKGFALFLCCLAFSSVFFSLFLFLVPCSKRIDGPNLFTKFKLLSYSAKTAAAGVAAPPALVVVLQSADYMRILFA